MSHITQIGQEMAIINARVLPAPTISYHPASKEPLITPREGAWNLRDKMVSFNLCRWLRESPCAAGVW